MEEDVLKILERVDKVLIELEDIKKRLNNVEVKIDRANAMIRPALDKLEGL